MGDTSQSKQAGSFAFGSAVDCRSFDADRVVIRFPSFAADEGLPLQIRELTIYGPEFAKDVFEQLRDVETDWLEWDSTRVRLGIPFKEDVVLRGRNVILKTVEPDGQDIENALKRLEAWVRTEQTRAISAQKKLAEIKTFVAKEIGNAEIRAASSAHRKEADSGVISVLKRVQRKLDD